MHLIADTAYLYTPWRTEYKSKVKKEDSVVCHMCRMASKNPGAQDFILLNTHYFVVALNTFPYSKGHILIIPRDHVKRMQDLPVSARAQLIELIADASTILETMFNCTGFNVGYNQAYNSGASIPEHLHVHIVPRYANKTDAFFNTIADTRLIEWDFPQLHRKMVPNFRVLQKKYKK